MKSLFSLLIAGLLVSLAVMPKATADPAVPGEIRFNRDIRPILSNRCFKCHGPDLKKGGLDLQASETATAKLKSGQHAIVPGQSGASKLIERVLSSNERERMPPSGKGEPLKPQEVALLKAWIDQGAKYEAHWAYSKPQRPALPGVKQKDWLRNDIDAFILSRLEREGLQPAAEADRTTLIRRVTLDLIGLPPSLEEVDAFINDATPNAYEKVVDRLLASPHYGERQARPWLDLARYADTNGYEADNRRTIWPYRDWVINAFNRDLPFDQFTIEQLAGDLLPNATLEQRVATGFHRNTMVNTEGGTDDEEFRIAAIVDRVNTTMEVWMGTTFACAQCHNHKYDPFGTKEYYQLFAFFNGSEDRGRSNAPEIPVPTPTEEMLRQKLQGEIARLQVILDQPTSELEAFQAKWEKASPSQKVTWSTLNLESATSALGAKLTKQPDGSVLASGNSPATDNYRLQASTDLQGITAIRLEVLPDNSLPAKGPGRSAGGNFVLNELRLKAAAKGQAEQAESVGLQNASADFAQQSFAVAGAIDGNPQTGWAIAPQLGKYHVAVFETKQDIRHEGGSVLVFTLDQSFGTQHTIGRLRLSATTAPRPVRLDGGLPDAIAQILATEAEKRTPEQRTELAKYYRSIAPELEKVRQQIAELRKQEAAIKPPTTLVMKELAQPRQTHVMVRGNHKNLGDAVSPGTPAKWHPLQGDSPKWNRLDLGRWLVSSDNPLVGRVTMNRLWAQHFGKGLVETGEDFGVQGELPTNPELLDWLATELIRQKWSMKAMHKLVVMSAAYRQSSKVTKEKLEKDPFNRLVSRGPRFRIEAEMVRDNALAISGLLSRKVGGPSVFPFQPDGVWANPYSGDRWLLSKDDDQYRRGLYTFWRRTAPYATFMSFDAPSREVCTERRSRTNTPLQALATLNDQAFVECAASLARRMMAERKATERDKAIRGFRLCVAREPRDAELDAILKLYRQSLDKYKNDAEAAKKLAGVMAVPSGVDVAELAAWTVVANVLLNLDETITLG